MALNKAHEWSVDEVSALVDYCEAHPVRDFESFGATIGRSRWAATCKAHELGYGTGRPEPKHLRERKWTPEELAIIDALRPAESRTRADYEALARKLPGRSVEAIMQAVCKRGKTGIANSEWSEVELDKLYRLFIKYIGSDHPYRQIAEHLPGRTPEACRSRCNREGWSIPPQVGPDGKRRYTLREIARLLGKTEGAVRHWGLEGVLPTLPHKTRRSAYKIAQERLWEWMEQPEHWHLYEPSKLRDLAWREHFTELRQGWITTEDAARILMTATNTVNSNKDKIKHVPENGYKLWWRRDDVLRFKQERYG